MLFCLKMFSFPFENTFYNTTRLIGTHSYATQVSMQTTTSAKIPLLNRKRVSACDFLPIKSSEFAFNDFHARPQGHVGKIFLSVTKTRGNARELHTDRSCKWRRERNLTYSSDRHLNNLSRIYLQSSKVHFQIQASFDSNFKVKN